MQSIKTVCPHCQKQYTVSVLKLRVAEGHVTCAICKHIFNAYRYMPSLYSKESLDQPEEYNLLPQHEGLQIFEIKAKASNINLQSYLNTIHSFELDMIKPSQHPLSHLIFKDHYKPHTQEYWVCIFLCICFALTLLPIIYYSIISTL